MTRDMYPEFCAHMRSKHPDIEDEFLQSLFESLMNPRPLSKKDMERANEVVRKYQAGEYTF